MRRDHRYLAGQSIMEWETAIAKFVFVFVQLCLSLRYLGHLCDVPAPCGFMPKEEKFVRCTLSDRLASLLLPA